jgi:hypothetical protein
MNGHFELPVMRMNTNSFRRLSDPIRHVGTKQSEANFVVFQDKITAEAFQYPCRGANAASQYRASGPECPDL